MDSRNPGGRVSRCKTGSNPDSWLRPDVLGTRASDHLLETEVPLKNLLSRSYKI